MTTETPAVRSVLTRPALLLLLLLAEGLALGLCFNGEALRQLPPGWWGLPLGAVGRALPIGTVVGAALLLVALPRICAALIQFPYPLACVWPLLLAHLLAYALLVGLSFALFGPIDAVVRAPGPWVMAWFGAAAATLLLWGLSVLPLSGARALLLDSPWHLAVGLLAGFAVVAVALVARHGWTPLQAGTLRLAFAIVRAVEPSATLDVHEFTISAGGFTVEINPGCSGYEGMGLVLLFVAIHLWLWRANLRFPRALLLLPIAWLAAWLANGFRIAALVEVGAHVSPQFVREGFHAYAGILLSVAVALGTTAAADRSAFFNRSPVSRQRHEPNPAAPWLVPFLAVLLAGWVTGLFTAGGVDRLYPIRVAVGALALWFYRDEYRQIDWRPSFASVVAGVLAFALWNPLARLTAGSGGIAPAALPAGAGGALWLISRILGSVLVIPAVEELAFRGYLARRWMSADFQSVPFRALSPAAILVSSAAFAALYGRLALPAFLAGLAYVLAARWRGRLADAVLAHALANALFCAQAFLTGSWAAWN
ncbi:MAG TPA: exosortase E/protease, VPEID-CTERM system [Tepidisphaeraceae bacterium]|jgi:exosortase E/protease (VPEID-CTERM system)